MLIFQNSRLFFEHKRDVENGHCWDSGFGKSALLSLLFSVSVLNGHGHLFSYRTYYAVNSLGLEREEDKSSQIYCLLQPLLLSTTQYALVCAVPPHTLLRPFQVLSNPRSSRELFLAVLLFFLHRQCLWVLLIWDQMLWLGVTEQTDRHSQHQVTVVPNLDEAVQSPPICHDFFKNLLKICVAVLLIRPGVPQQGSKIHQMTDKPDRLKPEGSAKHVWVSQNQELLHPQSALPDNISLALSFCVLMRKQWCFVILAT